MSDKAFPLLGAVPQVAKFTVATTHDPLTGTFPRGVLLLNYSSSDQVIFLGKSDTAVGNGFPLVAGAWIEMRTWTDLTKVYADASAGGADLRAIAL